LKSRIIIISKTKLLVMLLIIAALLLFIFALRTISINTLHYYDPIYKGMEDDKKIAFACNVVWGEEYLPWILTLLEEKDIKITFFIGGQWAEKNEELLRNIHNAGHELGNHDIMQGMSWEITAISTYTTASLLLNRTSRKYPGRRR